MTFQKQLLKWYDAHRRDLPWRTKDGSRVDPYHVFLSEAMLQQTQVVTVTPYFNRFIEQLPTIESLAAADEQTVLRLWQGLGYYSRARNLRKAAQAIVADHGGVVPKDLTQLLALPGVGRYTAGAIASIAHDCRAPILDGNVVRVLCRIDGVRDDPREPKTRDGLWLRAEKILPKARCGDFNSALMELGATVCTPRNPQCLICPVRSHCVAYREQIQDQIPPPKKSKPTPLSLRRVFVISCEFQGGPKVLIEQRPPSGRWAGLWQFVTVPVDSLGEKLLPPELPFRIDPPVMLGEVSHGLTHRRYTFQAFAARADASASQANLAPRIWTGLDELDHYPMSKPQLAIARLMREGA